MSIVRLSQKQLPADCAVFKNSTACPISYSAAEEVRKLGSELPIYWIDVIEQRELSNWVAEQYQVKHQSPQFLVIKNGKAVTVLNHSKVTVSNATAALLSDG
jgi:bacillithiol system protein YtxJ